MFQLSSLLTRGDVHALTVFCLLLVITSFNVAQADQALTNGDLEAAPFGTGWSIPEAVAFPGLVPGSTQAARIDTSLNAAGNWGLYQSNLFSGSATEWTLDLLFAALDPGGSSDRSFHLLLGSTNSVNSINLRVNGEGTLQAFDGNAWQNLSPVGAITFSSADFETTAVHRLVITGTGWDGVAPTYSVRYSDPNETNAMNLGATGVSFFQAFPNGGIAQVAFADAFSQADYVVDEVSLEFTPPPPPPIVQPFSGIYPHLAMTNSQNECGVGALAVWQDKLWAVTYSPHEPGGSDDRLYEIATDLTITIRPESVGGTPANRMIDLDSNQLIIGSHFIDAAGTVRTIPLSTMRGRMTSVANHPNDPNCVYFFTMEEGIYEVDVHSLDVIEIHKDRNGGGPDLVPGNHGKGGYSGQGMIFYANNGAGGCLAEWDGTGDGGDPNNWAVIDVNKYTDITGPNGPEGPYSPTDPVWSIGWDTKSVLLQVRDVDNGWQRYRLPKGSYTQDPDHGWYTEWPRIRDVKLDSGKYLMNKHCLLYEFPPTIAQDALGGIEPIARHQKMIVDYTDWNGQLVLATNDASKFGNPLTPKAQSNLVFTNEAELETYGKPAGFGGVWVREDIAAFETSERLFIHGFRDRTLHISHRGPESLDVLVEIDVDGNGNWSTHATLTVPAFGYVYDLLPSDLVGEWVRFTPQSAATDLTIYMHFFSGSHPQNLALVEGLAVAGTATPTTTGVLRLKENTSSDPMMLQFAADILDANGQIVAQKYYEMGGDLHLMPIDDPTTEASVRSAATTSAHFTIDAASVIITDSGGNRYRLPFGDPSFDTASAVGWPRGIREIVTERSMMNIHGTFYELPHTTSTRNPFSGKNFRRIKPITTHNLAIHDYCSWRGILVMTGNLDGAPAGTQRVVSEDGLVSLWMGSVDDLWRFGAPQGFGGPWNGTAVVADEPSDPYLMFGYDHKSAAFSHDGGEAVTFTIEIDPLGDNNWEVFDSVVVPAEQVVNYAFPAGYSAHWVRMVSSVTVNATAQFSYELPACEIVTDLDGDGDVDGQDGALFGDCVSGPDQTTAPRTCTPAQFERADVDGDGDVDLHDLARYPFTFSAACNTPNPVTRPNLIVILTDDQQFDALNANGNPRIITPSLNDLANNGIRFTRAGVVFSLCSPSRAAILTGRYNSANGVEGLDEGLNPGEVTFSEILKAAGYQTAQTGKWHLPGNPDAYGFDWYAFFRSNGTYYGRRVNVNGVGSRPSQHVDEFCADRAIEFIDLAHAKPAPFFLFHNTQTPHLDGSLNWPSEPETQAMYDINDMVLPTTWNDPYTDKPPYLATVRNRTKALEYGYDVPASLLQHTLEYYAVCTEMDASIGRVLQHVKDLGLSDNTYIVFLSDNGWFVGEHGFTSKVLPYEESFRVPMAADGPNVAPAVDASLTLNIDIAPTLLELAGLPIPSNMHGLSFAGLLRGGSSQQRNVAIYEMRGSFGGAKPTLAAVSERWKLIHTYPNSAYTTPNFVELYDLQADPIEMINRANDPNVQTIRQDLADAIADHIANVIS